MLPPIEFIMFSLLAETQKTRLVMKINIILTGGTVQFGDFCTIVKFYLYGAVKFLLQYSSTRVHLQISFLWLQKIAINSYRRKNYLHYNLDNNYCQILLFYIFYYCKLIILVFKFCVYFVMVDSQKLLFNKVFEFLA